VVPPKRGQQFRELLTSFNYIFPAENDIRGANDIAFGNDICPCGQVKENIISFLPFLSHFT